MTVEVSTQELLHLTSYILHLTSYILHLRRVQHDRGGEHSGGKAGVGQQVIVINLALALAIVFCTDSDKLLHVLFLVIL